jgi:hypothetical protein
MELPCIIQNYKTMKLIPSFDRKGKKTNVYIPRDNSDEKQPQFLYCCIDTDLLCAIVNKQIDPVELAQKELANRGLDNNGKWIGFKKH